MLSMLLLFSLMAALRHRQAASCHYFRRDADIFIDTISIFCYYSFRFRRLIFAAAAAMPLRYAEYIRHIPYRHISLPFDTPYATFRHAMLNTPVNSRQHVNITDISTIS